jgi:formylglycine-generating enzyme required for sulfatase activity
MSLGARLGIGVAVAAFGCGSAFSAQEGMFDAEPGPNVAAEASMGTGDHPEGSATTQMEAASLVDASTVDVPPPMPAMDDASKDQAVEAAAPCAGTGGPPGVRVSTYCIDSTEVTNHQYAAFLASQMAHTDNQPAVCAWNTTYVPTQDWPAAPGRDNMPVGWVDWCDALAFCKWAGKRMCGKIGGGSIGFSDFDKADLSQWYRACSKNGTLRYPYGQTVDTKACNTNAAGINHAVNVKELPGCEGGYPGLFDMVGNVEEWEDACTGTTGSNDTCRSRGLSYIYGSPDQGCALDDADTRSATFPDLGIRCCSD